MDVVKLTLGSSSSNKSHHSDELAFSIEPLGVAPPVLPAELSLPEIGALALAVVNILLVSYGIATILTPET